MDTTVLLAKFWGLLLVVTLSCFALSLCFNNKLTKFLQRLAEDQALIFFGGFISIVLGCATIALHNMWGTTNEIIVSLIGWLSLVKGATRMIMPELIMKTTMKMQANKKSFALPFIISIVLGIYLLSIGFGWTHL